MEANDAVTVAGMTRPKPLPNEVLADLGVSVATKLQCFRVLFLSFFSSQKWCLSLTYALISLFDYLTLIGQINCQYYVIQILCYYLYYHFESAWFFHLPLHLQHLGKYFKQSAKGLERQVAREARFYGALIR